MEIFVSTVLAKTILKKISSFRAMSHPGKKKGYNTHVYLKISRNPAEANH